MARTKAAPAILARQKARKERQKGRSLALKTLQAIRA